MQCMLFPTLFISHGGGPLPILGDPSHAGLTACLKGLLSGPLDGEKPDAIVMVSAHWAERATVHISSAPSPAMLYDYGGFPKETYEYAYPAPGSPDLAARIRDLLSSAGIDSKLDAARGYDHGVFVPLMLAVPNADVPIVCVSLLGSYDAAVHLAIGSALSSLRKDRILIIGSGSSFHNMRALMGGGDAAAMSEPFDEWLNTTLTRNVGRARSALLMDWTAAPSALLAHPKGGEVGKAAAHA